MTSLSGPSDEFPIHVPPLHTWDLNENSTRYDYVVAAPSDEDRVLMWSLWAAIAFASIVVILVVLGGLLSNSRVRNNPFNQFLIFLLLPDIIYAVLCATICLTNAMAEEFTSAHMCYLQSWATMFGLSGSAYMNAVLANEVHKMLLSGQEFLRYAPPSARQVAARSTGVLLFAAFVASWGVVQFENSPHRTLLFGGIACMPQHYNLATSLFYFLFFFPLVLLGPVAYVFYLAFRIWYKEMIPARGKRKALATFLFRLVAIFLIMWIPSLLLVAVFNQWVPTWGEWAGGAWSHLQGIVSAGFILTKPDARFAVRQLLTCKCKPFNAPNLPTFTTTRRESRPNNKSNSRKSSLRSSASYFWHTPSKLLPSRSQNNLISSAKQSTTSKTTNIHSMEAPYNRDSMPFEEEKEEEGIGATCASGTDKIDPFPEDGHRIITEQVEDIDFYDSVGAMDLGDGLELETRNEKQPEEAVGGQDEKEHDDT